MILYSYCLIYIVQKLSYQDVEALQLAVSSFNKLVWFGCRVYLFNLKQHIFIWQNKKAYSGFIRFSGLFLIKMIKYLHLGYFID